MKQINIGGVTPQQKNIAVNNRFGNASIAKQQGSTRVLYDSLPFDARTEFRFFEESNQRNFPLSNTGADGNKLGVGNSMVVERAYLTYGIFNPTTNAWTSLAKTDIASNVALLTSEFGFTIANSQVIKNIPILSFIPEFNKVAENNLNSNFEFDTQIIIPPLLEFVATLRMQKYAAVENAYLRLTIEGSGAIIAPKTTF